MKRLTDLVADQVIGDKSEDGFEIAQAMGIALLGLVVTAVFATGLEAVGVDVIAEIRNQLGL